MVAAMVAVEVRLAVGVDGGRVALEVDTRVGVCVATG
jgi:hypothetical protein